MRIGVVSDTHSKKLPKKMIDDFKKVDFIIHAGDICDMSEYQALARVKGTKAVCGNMDDGDIATNFPRKMIIRAGKFHIGLFHGEGPPKRILNRVKKEFEKDAVDAIVFGHSHEPLNMLIDGILFFNPGSPNDKIFAPYCSYGILDVSKNGITGEIIHVEE